MECGSDTDYWNTGIDIEYWNGGLILIPGLEDWYRLMEWDNDKDYLNWVGTLYWEAIYIDYWNGIDNLLLE